MKLKYLSEKGKVFYGQEPPSGESTTQSEIYRRGNVENGWKSLIMVDHAWKCQ